MKRNHRLVYIILLTIFCWSATTSRITASPSDEEAQLWRMISDTKDIAEIDIYISSYPEGTYLDEAIRKKWRIIRDSEDISRIRRYVADNPDSPYTDEAIDTIWHVVDRKNNLEAYDQYTRDYPDSPYVELAVVKMRKIMERAAWDAVKSTNDINLLAEFIETEIENPYLDDAVIALWKLVEASNDINTVQEYIVNYPDSEFAPFADKLLWDLVKESHDPGVITMYQMNNPESKYLPLAKLITLRLTKRAKYVTEEGDIVTDSLKGLTWQKHTDEKMSWEKAKIYCDQLTLSDKADWRLPIRQELTDLYDIRQYFPDLRERIFWTASQYRRDSLGAWIADARHTNSNLDFKNSLYYVRCVREMEE